MRGEMFCRGQNVMPIDQKASPCKPVDGGHAHARAQKRIFSVGFFGASPARVARQIEHRSERLIGARGSHFVGGGGENFLH